MQNIFILIIFDDIIQKLKNKENLIFPAARAAGSSSVTTTRAAITLPTTRKQC